jgi:HPt (histidine-containing phosphotransfer) domain-containing protein
MSGIQSRFRARFVETARARQKKVESSMAAGDFEAVASELHTLSGEAGLLSFETVADIARRASHATRESDRRNLRELRDLLEQLTAAIGALERA